MKENTWLKVFLALASTFVVGLGQILKGDSEKGIKFLLLFYFALPAIFYFSLLISGAIFLLVFGIGLVFAVIFWGYNIIDAYKT